MSESLIYFGPYGSTPAATFKFVTPVTVGLGPYRPPRYRARPVPLRPGALREPLPRGQLSQQPMIAKLIVAWQPCSGRGTGCGHCAESAAVALTGDSSTLYRLVPYAATRADRTNGFGPAGGSAEASGGEASRFTGDDATRVITVSQ